MNIILLETHELADNLVRLDGYRAEHIIKILRSKVGDRVKLGIIDGKTGSGTIEEIKRTHPRSVLLSLAIDQEPPEPASLDILLALPRPIMFKRVLSQAAALGIGHLYVVNATRVEKSFWDASVISPAGYRPHLIQGLEQAMDTRLPTVSFHKGFKPFVQSTLPAVSAGYHYLLAAHPASDENLPGILDKGPGRVLLAVGPEGGWSDYEVTRLHQAGFTLFSIGPRILKVDTAVIALHSMITVLNRQP